MNWARVWKQVEAHNLYRFPGPTYALSKSARRSGWVCLGLRRKKLLVWAWRSK